MRLGRVTVVMRYIVAQAATLSLTLQLLTRPFSMPFRNICHEENLSQPVQELRAKPFEARDRHRRNASSN